MTKDKMIELHHRLIGHEIEHVLEDSEEQGGLACCTPWGLKESDSTEQLNNNQSLKSLMMILMI